MRVLSTGAVAAAFLSLAAPGRAQLDPDRRLLLEAGHEQGLGAPGPTSPYGYLYWNQPKALGERTVLRLALAPVYADAELGVRDALPRTDLGFGIAGGGFAFSQTEVARGDEKRQEAFIGHGGGPSASLYPRLGLIGPAPLNGVLRASAVRTSYERVTATDAAFLLPPDSWTGVFRAGLRLGGQEPGLSSGRAAEVSAWWETRLRDHDRSYGFARDRRFERSVDHYWTRLLFSVPAAGASTVSGGVSLGGSSRIGRLTAYRLGGMLTQTSEFPLVLPGYFAGEVMARRYAHAWGRLGAPLRSVPGLTAVVFAAGASAAPLAGTDAGGTLHAGAGTGLLWAPKDEGFVLELDYGYAPTALRAGRRGAHALALSVQWDFLVPAATRGRHEHQSGLRWFLDRALIAPFRK